MQSGLAPVMFDVVQGRGGYERAKSATCELYQVADEPTEE
jgi:hypothetical protein